MRANLFFTSLNLCQILWGEKNPSCRLRSMVFLYLWLDAFFTDKRKVISALFDADKMRPKIKQLLVAPVVCKFLFRKLFSDSVSISTNFAPTELQ